MNPRYPEVAARAGHRCEYCRAPEAIFNLPFEVEHIVPPRSGGSESFENLALSCRGCNLFKSAHIDGLDPLSKAKVNLFNPRSDLWESHFKLDQTSGHLNGLSDVGRATIERLRMNRMAQVTARLAWLQLGLFP